MVYSVVKKFSLGPIRRVFKMMLAGWHNEPIKSMLFDHRPNSGWAQSINLEIRLSDAIEPVTIWEPTA